MCFLSSDRNPIPEQSTDPTKVQLGETVSSIGVINRNVCKEWLTEKKYLKDSYVIKAHTNMGKSPWRRQPGEHVAQITGTSSGWGVSVSSDPRLNFFQAAQLLCASPKWLGRSHMFFALRLPSIWGNLSSFIAYYDWKGPSESGQFHWLSKTILNCFPSSVKSVSGG